MRASDLLIACALLSGCVAVPVHRPIAPMMGDHVAEIGIAPTAQFGQSQVGVGAGAWTAVQVVDNVDVLAHAFGSDLLPYDGSAPVLSDSLFGAGLGLRGRYPIFEHMIIGGELLVEYDQRTGGDLPEQVLTIIGGMPVAEEAFPGFWVYTDLRLGIAIPLQGNDPRGAFFGVQEVPLGVAWEVAPWLVLVAEGGFALVVQGGYGSVGAAFRF